MIRALVWKEYREHRSIWLTLALVAFASLVGVAQIAGVERHPGAISPSQERLYVVALTLAWLYGMVCGAMLLAGEREAETLPFLDALPPSRLRLWGMKFLIGFVLLFSMVLVLVGIAAGIRLVVGPVEMTLALLALLFAGTLGFGWGMYFSAGGSSVLNVIGWAMLGQIVGSAAAFLLLFVPLSILIQLLFSRPLGPEMQNGLQALCVVALIPATLAGSVWRFTRPDRMRRRGAVLRPQRLAGGRSGWRVLLWLTWRQARLLALGSALFALAAGFLLLVGGWTIWPSATLVLGVLWGLGVFLDEQRQGCFRFLADQRLPLRPVWGTKVAVRFLLLTLTCALTLLPGAVKELVRLINHPAPYHEREEFLARVFGPGLLAISAQPWVFLTLCPVNGFCVGVLAGLVCRKSLVAGAVAFSATGFLVLAWVPSLPAGGLHLWQLGAVPLLLLIASRLLMRPWTAGRLAARGPILTLVVVIGASVAWVASNLWYRAWEIPEVPEKYDLQAFKARLPKLDDDEAGREIRSACSELALNLRSNQTQKFMTQAREVLEGGWSERENDLGAWLDERCQEGWYQKLYNAADVPPGVVERPVDLTVFTFPRSLESARTIPLLLASRGLQRQAAGNPKDYVEQLRVGLSLARNLRRQSIFVTVYASWEIERALFRGLERWLEGLDGHPELLRQALTHLREHEAALPADFSENVLAEYVVASESLKDIEKLVAIGFPHSEESQAVGKAVALFWQVPWEQTRVERLLRMVYQGEPEQTYQILRTGPRALALLRVHGIGRDGANAAQARLRAAILQVALRLYQAEHPGPAESLDVLAPRYLPSVPRDPFDGRPFRYRLSKREWVDQDGQGLAGPGGENFKERRVKRGQGVLWCIDDDRDEDGARRPSASPYPSGQDYLFLVPLPASQRR